MSNEILNQNADEQDPENQKDAATKNSPADIKMEEQKNNDAIPASNPEKTEGIKQSIEEMPQGGIEGVPFPDFPEVESTQAALEPQPTEKEIHAEALATPHDDFDWSVDKRNVTSYNKEERQKYDEVYDKTFKQINDNEMIHGTVVGMTKTDVVINIGFKSDGLVSLNEFRDTPNLKVGDEVELIGFGKRRKTGMEIFTLAASRPVLRVHGKELLTCTKPARLLPALLPAKPKADLSWMFLEWKHFYQDLKLT